MYTKLTIGVVGFTCVLLMCPIVWFGRSQPESRRLSKLPPLELPPAPRVRPKPKEKSTGTGHWEWVISEASKPASKPTAKTIPPRDPRLRFRKLAGPERALSEFSLFSPRNFVPTMRLIESKMLQRDELPHFPPPDPDTPRPKEPAYYSVGIGRNQLETEGSVAFAKTFCHTAFFNMMRNELLKDMTLEILTLHIYDVNPTANDIKVAYKVKAICRFAKNGGQDFDSTGWELFHLKIDRMERGSSIFHVEQMEYLQTSWVRID